MEFDETKKIEVEVSRNDFVENRVVSKKRFSLKDRGLDLLDIAIVPIAIGVFISLGFLFATLFGNMAVATTIGDATSLIGGLM